jgi:hypothetical protein
MLRLSRLARFWTRSVPCPPSDDYLCCCNDTQGKTPIGLNSDRGYFNFVGFQFMPLFLNESGANAS